MGKLYAFNKEDIDVTCGDIEAEEQEYLDRLDIERIIKQELGDVEYAVVILN